jgi:hypothetical protein
MNRLEMARRIRDAAGYWWDFCTRAADVMRPIGYRAADALCQIIDRDHEPCPVCDEPGTGAHVDCDHPELGRMTRSERLAAFGEARREERGAA